MSEFGFHFSPHLNEGDPEHHQYWGYNSPRPSVNSSNTLASFSFRLFGNSQQPSYFAHQSYAGPQHVATYGSPQPPRFAANYFPPAPAHPVQQTQPHVQQHSVPVPVERPAHEAQQPVPHQTHTPQPAVPSGTGGATASEPDDLHFAKNSSTLTASARAQSKIEAATIKAQLDKNPELKIQITGSADATGTAALNDRLSLARAKATEAELRTNLTQLGVPADKMKDLFEAHGTGAQGAVGDTAHYADNRSAKIALTDQHGTLLNHTATLAEMTMAASSIRAVRDRVRTPEPVRETEAKPVAEPEQHLTGDHPASRPVAEIVAEPVAETVRVESVQRVTEVPDVLHEVPTRPSGPQVSTRFAQGPVEAAARATVPHVLTEVPAATTAAKAAVPDVMYDAPARANGPQVSSRFAPDQRVTAAPQVKPATPPVDLNSPTEAAAIENARMHAAAPATATTASTAAVAKPDTLQPIEAAVDGASRPRRASMVPQISRKSEATVTQQPQHPHTENKTVADVKPGMYSAEEVAHGAMSVRADAQTLGGVTVADRLTQQAGAANGQAHTGPMAAADAAKAPVAKTSVAAAATGVAKPDVVPVETAPVVDAKIAPETSAIAGGLRNETTMIKLSNKFGPMGKVIAVAGVADMALRVAQGKMSATDLGTTALDVAVPGSAEGFKGITDTKRSWVDRSLNAADTATGTVMTGGLVVAGATALTGYGGVAGLAVAGVAGAANIGVQGLKDAAYVTGLSQTPGPISQLVHDMKVGTAPTSGNGSVPGHAAGRYGQAVVPQAAVHTDASVTASAATAAASAEPATQAPHTRHVADTNNAVWKAPTSGRGSLRAQTASVPTSVSTNGHMSSPPGVDTGTTAAVTPTPSVQNEGRDMTAEQRFAAPAKSAARSSLSMPL